MDDQREYVRALQIELDNDVNDSNENLLQNEDESEIPLMLSSTERASRRMPHRWFYEFTFIAFGVLGTVPWNFFINANEFWDYKFRDVNHVEPLDPTHRTTLQSKFESFLSIASMVPSLIGAIACNLLSTKFRTHYRIVVPMIAVFLLFSIITIVSELNTDTWQLTYLLITLSTVAIINGLVSYNQCSIMGFAGTIGPSFMNAMMTGQSCGGVLASIARIATAFFKGSVAQSSRYYFNFALAIIIAIVIVFFVLSKTSFYKFHIQKVEDDKLLINEELPEKPSVWSILLQIKLYILSIVIVFITTLAVFPSIATLVVSVHSTSGSLWTGKLFIPVACFLLFNVSDLSGRCLANWVFVIPHGSISLLVISILRMSFIPLFMLCNAEPRHLLPVVFHNDWMFIILITIFGITNGYLSSISMMYAPKVFEGVREQETASVLMALCMSIGIAIGAVMSSGLVVLL